MLEKGIVKRKKRKRRVGSFQDFSLLVPTPVLLCTVSQPIGPLSILRLTLAALAMSTASTMSAWRIFAVSSPSSPSRNLQVSVIVALKLPNKKWVSQHHNQKLEPHKSGIGEAHIRVHSPGFFSKQKLRSSSSDTCFLFLCFSHRKSASCLGLRMW